jgi:NADH-quinone oxidoreductase subunit J
VGDEMMTRFVVPFEVAGLLLTAALVGAIALAHREGDDQPAAPRAPGAVVRGAGEPSGNGHPAQGAPRSQTIS